MERCGEDVLDDDGAVAGGGEVERRDEKALDRDTRLSRASSPQDTGPWLRSSYPRSVVCDEVIPLSRRLDRIEEEIELIIKLLAKRFRYSIYIESLPFISNKSHI
ncbi:hypothetical protein GUJ93_ZPchr0006g45032 [Zizania palustris]|uniref:Uncharacterized protein n=1 Tax=Zizania palustris TaxID=103762 RepID=A0A8J5SJP4_ZIZPA|nr:hypothetical protein GUJ93_ZPchr0006g45032 [Zizania palustris]